MRRFVAAVATSSLVILGLGAPGILTPASAAVGSESQSSSQFLDATLLGGDLSSVAGIDGAQATYVDGTTPGTSVVDDAPLDVTALSLLTLPLPGTVAVGDLLDLGLITQHAEADPNGTSSSTTQTAGLSVDLLQLLGSTPALSQASLDLGAVGSTASLDGPSGTLTRNTEVAQALLNLQSPALGTMTTSIQGAVTTLGNTMVGLQGTLNTAVNTALNGVVALLEPTGAATLSGPGVTVDASRLNTAVQNVLNQPLSTSLVTLDPATGRITVNLAGGIDLNNLAPNTTLLDAATLQQVTADVNSLLQQLQSEVNQITTNALDYVDVTINKTATVTAPITGTNLGSVNLSYSGSLQDLIDGSSPLGLTAGGTLGPLLTPVLGTARTLVQTTIGNAINTTVQTAVSTAGNAVQTAVTTATNALDPALTALGAVAQVNLNVQNASDGMTSQADVTAVQVKVLTGTAVTLNLATSTVGPNTYQQYAPTLAASGPVQSGDATTVTGGGWPPNSTVSLQLTDPDGNPVGNPVTVTTDANGAIPAGTTVPVPAGSPVGTYTVVGTTAGVPPVSAPFDVIDTVAPAAPVITGPANGTVTNDPTPTISGTGEPGATVSVTDQGGTVLGTAVVDGNGDWSFPSSTLPDGTYTITATQTDPAGNTSPASAPDTFTVDTTAPAAPVITGPADGSTVGDTTPTITGTGEAGDTVTVTVDGNVIGATVVQPDGTWSLDVPTPLADGTHTVSATQTDAAGNTSPASPDTTFTVDTSVPAPVITGPENGTVTSDTTPAITGTGTPGDTVTVTDQDGTVLGTAVVGSGGAWSFDSTTLDDGPYTITATQTDTNGNVSPASSPVIFTVDTAAPAAPVITGPADGTVTNDTTPTITGTGEPGDTVTVTDQNGRILGTAVVDGTGAWSFDSTTLPDGTYTITATQTDAAGNTSPASAPDSFTVDTAAPAAPVITGPADGTVTNDTTPTITGTGEPGATVTVTDQAGTVLGTAVVGQDGTWSLDSPPLADGDYTITATQTDPAGNTSPASAPDSFTVDTGVPAAPVITSPADGGLTRDATPPITGTGEAGDTVTVTIDGTVIGTTTVGSDGTWSLTPTDPLADGSHTVTATQTDPAGNTSPASDPVTFTVDATAPTAPVITGPTDGTTTSDPTPTISGTGEPGATVTVTDQSGTVLGTAVVGQDGGWSFDSVPLTDGAYTITATQIDAAGNLSPASAPDSFTVDTTAPAAPVINGPADGSTTGDSTPAISGTGEPGATVTVTDQNGNMLGTAVVDPTGAWSFDSVALPDGAYTITATQTDAAGNTSPASAPSIFTVDTTAPDAPVITGPADGSATSDPTPPITGTGEAGATVTVTVDGAPIGTTKVGSDGTWSLTPTDPLADGSHTVTATQTDPAGNASPASAPVTFTVDTAAPAAPVITGPADGSTTSDPTPRISGTGEPGDTVTVTDQSGIVLGTAVVDDAGAWSFSSTHLADGPYTITATQTDAAGNVSPASAPDVFTVDTTAPAAPVITGPADGSTIGDSTPTITGTGEVGDTVTVTVDGAVIGTAVVGPTGAWSLDVPTALADGDHTVIATQTDAAGNTSPASSPSTFTVDTTEPAPAITTPANDDVTNDATPTISGAGQPGDTVTVTDQNGNVLGTAVVDGTGAWSFDSTALADGTYTITATETDATGNTSQDSSPVIFTVDTTAPAAPVVTGPSDGSATNDRTPPISGTGEPGDTVTVSIDGTVIGTTTVGSDGTWTLTTTDPLADGPHAVTATQTDAAGNTSPASAPVTFTVDTVAPDAPATTGPADGSTTNDPTPTITGTGEPGDTVTVTLDGTVIGTATVGSDGTWTLTTTAPLPDGPHTVTATQTDPAGNTSGPSAPVTFTVDTVAPDAPVITGPADGTPTNDPTPTITGTGEPGDTVTVKDQDGNVIGTATVDGGGIWTLTPTTPLPDGTTALTATQTDAAGNTSPPSDVVHMVVDTTVAAPAITSPADGSTTTDHTPTITGTGEPGATATVSVDGALLGTPTVGPGGHWSIPVTTPLADGSHVVSATQTDQLGNVSGSTASSFSVVPAPPAITSPQDGDVVSSTPTVSGTAPAGTTVDVLVDGTSAATTPATASGSWSVTLPQIACGKHTLTATAATAGRLLDRLARPAHRAVSNPSHAVDIKVPCTGNPAADTGVGSQHHPGSGHPASTGPSSDTSNAVATGSGSALPNTGAPANLVPLGILAGLMLVGGFALIGVAVRRRS